MRKRHAARHTQWQNIKSTIGAISNYYFCLRLIYIEHNLLHLYWFYPDLLKKRHKKAATIHFGLNISIWNMETSTACVAYMYFFLSSFYICVCFLNDISYSTWRYILPLWKEVWKSEWTCFFVLLFFSFFEGGHKIKEKKRENELDDEHNEK